MEILIQEIIHLVGKQRKGVEVAREHVAKIINANPKEIILHLERQNPII